MDDLLDHILSSSSWSDVNSIQRSSWVGNRPTQTTVLLPSSIGVYDGDGKDSTGRMVPSSHTIESLATISSSLVACGDSTIGLDKRSVLGGVHPQEVVPNYERKPSLNGGLNTSFRSGYFPFESSTTIPTTGLSSPNLFPVFGSSSMSASLFSESSHVESNSSESSGFHQLLASGDSHSLPLIPQLWIPKSYGSDSSPSPILGQDKLHLEREHLESGESVFGHTILQPDKSSASVSTNGQNELHNYPLPSLAVGPQINFKQQTGLQSQPQTALATATGGCNGTVKPRVRARRGQATDPHSIAERLRREKIAERMKNLQELVPNSNKTDKASMLDEIIEYVKFLQLQVKVLSMSRLGATGAVVPLITDDQAEGSGGLLLSPSTGEDGDPCESPENIAFEQEVVKLMESNVTTAMQYLRSKGLCLMPIALAAAMSGAKAFPSCSVTDDRKKPGLTQGLVGLNSGSIVSAMSQVVCDDEIVTRDNAIGDQSPASVRTDDYNGAIIKQEAGQKTTCSDRELKLESN